MTKLPPADYDRLIEECDLGDARLLYSGRAGGFHDPLIVRVQRRDGSVWEAEDGRPGWQLPECEALLATREATTRDFAALLVDAQTWGRGAR